MSDDLAKQLKLWLALASESDFIYATADGVAACEALVKRGLLDRTAHHTYSITDAGRDAIA